MKFSLLIIDMDPLVYRCGFAIEKHDKELDVLHVEPVKHAYYNVNSMMRKCFKRANCTNYVGYLTPSGRENFRFDVYPAYKDNRKGAIKPVYYKELRHYLVNRWNGVITQGQEADDACSIAQCQAHPLGFDQTILNTVTASFDKDFNNFPGWHYNYLTDELYYVTELKALQNFYLQILTGDVSDGIPRIAKGWRQKNTELLVKEAKTEEELEMIIFNEISDIKYGRRNLTEVEGSSIIDEITWRGQLVWLRRKEGELWVPKIKK